MEHQDRHPACPNEHHVREFVPWLLEGKHSGGRSNSDGTVETKLENLSRIWRFWQDEPALPEAYNQFNPFELTLGRAGLSRELPPDPPYLPLSNVRDAVHSLTHIRDRATTVIQLKLGLRAGEVVNIRLEDLALGGEIADHYPELGTNPHIADYENAIYIPPRDDDDLPWDGRPGNKSRRPRIMPLDDELRRTFRRVLLIRPNNPDGWVFLTKRTHSQIEPMYVNEAMKPAFKPYNGDERHRDITSHYGRHYFSTFWRNKDVNAEYIKYMRGDATSDEVDSRDTLATYIHTYYEDIQDLYVNNIFKLRV